MCTDLGEEPSDSPQQRVRAPKKNASDLDLFDRIVNAVVMQGVLAGVFVGGGGERERLEEEGWGHNLSRDHLVSTRGF